MAASSEQQKGIYPSTFWPDLRNRLGLFRLQIVHNHSHSKQDPKS